MKNWMRYPISFCFVGMSMALFHKIGPVLFIGESKTLFPELVGILVGISGVLAFHMVETLIETPFFRAAHARRRKSLALSCV